MFIYDDETPTAGHLGGEEDFDDEALNPEDQAGDSPAPDVDDPEGNPDDRDKVDQPGGNVDPQDGQPIPYPRFKEVNEQNKALRTELEQRDRLLQELYLASMQAATQQPQMPTPTSGQPGNAPVQWESPGEQYLFEELQRTRQVMGQLIGTQAQSMRSQTEQIFHSSIAQTQEGMGVKFTPEQIEAIRAEASQYGQMPIPEATQRAAFFVLKEELMGKSREAAARSAVQSAKSGLARTPGTKPAPGSVPNEDSDSLEAAIARAMKTQK